MAIENIATLQVVTELTGDKEVRAGIKRVNTEAERISNKSYKIRFGTGSVDQAITRIKAMIETTSRMNAQFGKSRLQVVETNRAFEKLNSHERAMARSGAKLATSIARTGKMVTETLTPFQIYKQRLADIGRVATETSASEKAVTTARRLAKEELRKSLGIKASSLSAAQEMQKMQSQLVATRRAGIITSQEYSTKLEQERSRIMGVATASEQAAAAQRRLDQLRRESGVGGTSRAGKVGLVHSGASAKAALAAGAINRQEYAARIQQIRAQMRTGTAQQTAGQKRLAAALRRNNALLVERGAIAGTTGRRVTSSAAHSASALHRVARATEATNVEMRAMGRIVANLRGVFEHAFGGLIAFFAVGKIQEFVASIDEANKAYARIINTINTGTNSMTQAKADFQYLIKLSEKWGIDLQSTADAYAKLAVSAGLAGIHSKALNKVFSGLAMAFTATHRTGDQVNRFLIQLEQAISNGKFMSRDINAMSQSMSGAREIFKEAAQSIGKNMSDLASGAFNMKALLLALGQVMRGTFKDAAEKASHSLVAETNRLHSIMFALKTSGNYAETAAAALRQLNESLLSSEGRKAFLHFVDTISSAFASLVHVATFVIDHIDAITAAFKVLASVLIGRAIAGILLTIGRRFNLMWINLGKLNVRLIIATRRIGRLGFTIRGLSSAFKALRFAEVASGIGALIAIVGTAISLFFMFKSNSQSLGEQIKTLNSQIDSNKNHIRELAEEYAQLTKDQQAAFAVDVAQQMKKVSDVISLEQKKIANAKKQIYDITHQTVSVANRFGTGVHYETITPKLNSNQKKQIDNLNDSIVTQVAALQKSQGAIKYYTGLIRAMKAGTLSAYLATHNLNDAIYASGHAADNASGSWQEIIDKMEKAAAQAGKTKVQLKQAAVAASGGGPIAQSLVGVLSKITDLRNKALNADSVKERKGIQEKIKQLNVERAHLEAVIKTPFTVSFAKGADMPGALARHALGVRVKEKALLEKYAKANQSLFSNVPAITGQDSKSTTSALKKLDNMLTKLTNDYKQATEEGQKYADQLSKADKILAGLTRHTKAHAKAAKKVKAIKAEIAKINDLLASQRKRKMAAEFANFKKQMYYQETLFKQRMALNANRPLMSSRSFQNQQAQNQLKQQQQQRLLQLESQRGIASAQGNPQGDQQAALLTKKIGLVQKQIDGQVKLNALIKSQTLLYQNQGKIIASIAPAFQNWADSAHNAAAQVNSAVSQAMNDATNMIVKFLNTGKLSWRQFASSVLKMIEQIVVRLLLAKAISAALGATGGADNSKGMQASATKLIVAGGAISLGALLLSNAATKLATAASFLWAADAMSFAANGAAFGSGGNAIPFAKGGVVNSPRLFKFAQGTGMMGEAGPEAIMPLGRNKQGQLGIHVIDVKSNGGSNTTNQLSFPISVQVNSEGGMSDEEAKDHGKKIGKTVQSIVLNEINEQMRPGGRLYGAMAQ